MACPVYGKGLKEVREEQYEKMKAILLEVPQKELRSFKVLFASHSPELRGSALRCSLKAT
jgi:hypothetical protein